MSPVDIGAGRTYRGVKPQERQDVRRSQLVDAAVEVFGTTGYRTATVGKICATAGLTKRYFYESFDDSEALLLEAYRYATDRLRASVERAAGTDTARTESTVEDVLFNFFRTIAEDPRLARIAFFEILGVSNDVDRVYRRVTGSFVDTIIAVNLGAFERSTVPLQHRQTVATGLVGAVLLMAQQWVLSGYAQPIESVVHSAAAIFTAVFGQQDR